MKIKLRILILIFIFLALQERYVTAARQVKKVSNVAAKKEMEESGYFSSQKEIVPSEKITRNGGRKMRKKAIKGKSRNGDTDDDFMAFASDYHPPKPHPPKNN